MHVSKDGIRPKRKESPTPKAIHRLSERQELILKLMSEGRTNFSISELLGYSESTIRQETIKIYSFLQCDGREEASMIYKEHQTQNAGV